jgi:7,8-dihydroneopterin aldolase/epimerase/oxygenase
MTEPTARAIRRTIFVRALEVQAEVGLYAHEHGIRQPLVCDVELEVAEWGYEAIGDTVNYERIRDRTVALTRAGHWKLVESFAEKLAQVLMEDHRILKARVRVEKPTALRPDAAAAGVEIILDRA